MENMSFADQDKCSKEKNNSILMGNINYIYFSVYKYVMEVYVLFTCPQCLIQPVDGHGCTKK